MILALIILALAFSLSLAWLWAGGIEYMQENHPDYKGEDFLNWDIDEEDKNQIQ